MQETQEMWVQFLHWEDPLEKGMATHSSILGWENTWAEEPGGLQSMGSQRVRYSWVTKQQQQQQIVCDRPRIQIQPASIAFALLQNNQVTSFRSPFYV